MAAKKKAKKKAAKKKTAKKAVAPAKKIKAIKEPMTKSALYTELADRTELKKKDIVALFAELSDIINAHVRKNGAGVFTMPGLMKVKVVRKPATKARPGINPFTGEETIFKAKPARNVVKVQPLKALKDMAL
ncbi:MAG: HU family DNA-binding protein [Gammaproteobacteria bacterium]|nr:HU family DNA-binding protein [Gammaproteobacteria bacterium]MCW8986965.1 HU family DNA-binding protein [Gammaproteobacteria bacterium]MCW9032223.1 HU family DNA-binding protein [Gammaproteobacteria bacterium]